MAKTSKFETKLLDDLEKEIKLKIERQYILPETSMVFDGCIPVQKILIEVDGDYWHKGADSQLRDAKKDQAALIKGYTIIRIKEADYKKNKGLITQRIKTRCKMPLY